MHTLQKRDRRLSPSGHVRAVERLRQDKARLDLNRVCTVPACSTRVSPENLGSLCTRHRWRQKEAGHAWHPMPRGKPRKAARRAVARYLDAASQSNDAGRLLTLLQAAISRKLREPVSNALKPAQIRRETHSLTTKGKSQIVWAWLNQRQDFDRLAYRLLIEAMTLEVWARCFYEGQKVHLPRLLHTTVGRTAVWCSHIQETKIRTTTQWVSRSCYPASEGPMQKVSADIPVTDRWRPTPYVRVAVGKRVFLALREALPANWITDNMIADTLRDYQSMKEQSK